MEFETTVKDPVQLEIAKTTPINPSLLDEFLFA
jgi:hypothetical protein